MPCSCAYSLCCFCCDVIGWWLSCISAMTAGHATLANIKILSCVCTKPKNYVSKGAIGGGVWGRSRVETRIEFISRKCCEKIFVCVIFFRSTFGPDSWIGWKRALYLLAGISVNCASILVHTVLYLYDEWSRVKSSKIVRLAGKTDRNVI